MLKNHSMSPSLAIVALSLGFLGSLHCIGMCGPIALTCQVAGDSQWASFKRSIFYNLGRTLSYGLLGLAFGLIGSVAALADIQQILSITLGIILILSFVLSINIDNRLSSFKLIKRWSEGVRIWIGQMMVRNDNTSLYLGIGNGFLPCGLVYLALAGSISTGSIIGGWMFMSLFGIGTIPALLSLTFGFKLISPNLRSKFRSILPYVTLCFGLYLIWRGVAIDTPKVLNFWEAITQPVLCH